MKILFNKNIPAHVIQSFVDDGHRVHIYAGDELFSKQKPVFKLAKASGVNEAFVHWGCVKHIVDNNQIEMFISDDDKHSINKVFERYIPESINLSSNMNFARVLEERWVTVPGDTKSGESCPICITLQDMSWVKKNEPVTYSWSGGSKIINGLPQYRQAHSAIGNGSWKVGDDKCKCYKEFRSAIVPDVVDESIVVDTTNLSVHFNICNHEY